MPLLELALAGPGVTPRCPVKALRLWACADHSQEYPHTAVHTTVAGPSGHLPTLGRRVLQLTETTGQPGVALIGPASRAQRLAARGASKGIWTAFATIRDETR